MTNLSDTPDFPPNTDRLRREPDGSAKTPLRWSAEEADDIELAAWSRGQYCVDYLYSTMIAGLDADLRQLRQAWERR
jgi:hypothetical protein